LGLGLYIRNGLKGWANIYLGKEEDWGVLLSKITGPLLLLGLGLIIWRTRATSRPDRFPHPSAIIWLVLLTQNIPAQLGTGPWSSWNEVAFSLYYLVLFALSAVIVHHFHCLSLR